MVNNTPLTAEQAQRQAVTSEQGVNEEVFAAEDSTGNVERTKMKISIKGEEQKDPSDATSILVSNSVLLSYYNSRPEELGKIG